jgi:membrane protease YdiL (CAAX protease family)
MNHKLKNILAICIGVLPINIIMIWYRLTHSEGFSTVEMLLYPLLFGGGNILLILALNKYLLKEKIKDFNPGKREWTWDISIGILLTAIYFLLLFIERATLAKILPQGKPPSQEVINGMIEMAKKPILLAIWLGPVVWIGVSIFEELQRVFLLNCFWRLSNNRYWESLSILLSAFLWGFTHLYQGPFGIISISFQGIIMGLFYYKFRRIWPLIISHALYDSIQVIMFVIQVS